MSTHFGRGTVNIGKHPLTSLSCCIGTGTLTGNRVRMCRVDRRTWNKTIPFTYTDISFTLFLKHWLAKKSGSNTHCTHAQSMYITSFFFLKKTLGCHGVRVEYTLFAHPINVHHKLLLFLKHWVAMESGSNTHCLHAQRLYITSFFFF